MHRLLILQLNVEVRPERIHHPPCLVNNRKVTDTWCENDLLNIASAKKMRIGRRKLLRAGRDDEEIYMRQQECKKLCEDPIRHSECGALS